MSKHIPLSELKFNSREPSSVVCYRGVWGDNDHKTWFENTVTPKKWRYLESLPVDAQGKKKKEDIEILFTEEGQN